MYARWGVVVLSLFLSGCINLAGLFSPVEDLPRPTKYYYRVLKHEPNACRDYKPGDRFFRDGDEWFVIPAGNPGGGPPGRFEFAYKRGETCR